MYLLINIYSIVWIVSLLLCIDFIYADMLVRLSEYQVIEYRNESGMQRAIPYNERKHRTKLRMIH